MTSESTLVNSVLPFLVAFSIVEDSCFGGFIEERNACVEIVILALLDVRFDGFSDRSFELSKVEFQKFIQDFD